MPDKKTKKRASPISYRPPKELREEFHARVQSSGRPINAFLTEAGFGRNRHRPAELEKLAVILAKAAQIEKRELRSLEQSLFTDQRIQARGTARP